MPRGRRLVDAGNDQRRRPLAQEDLEQPLLLQAGIVRVAHLDLEAGVAEPVIDAAHHVGENIVRQRRHQHADDIGARRGQRPGVGVRHIAKLRRRPPRSGGADPRDTRSGSRNARDTVMAPTPASFATSAIVGRPPPRRERGFIVELMHDAYTKVSWRATGGGFCRYERSRCKVAVAWARRSDKSRRSKQANRQKLVSQHLATN